MVQASGFPESVQPVLGPAILCLTILAELVKSREPQNFNHLLDESSGSIFRITCIYNMKWSLLKLSSLDLLSNSAPKCRQEPGTVNCTESSVTPERWRSRIPHVRWVLWGGLKASLEVRRPWADPAWDGNMVSGSGNCRWLCLGCRRGKDKNFKGAEIVVGEAECYLGKPELHYWVQIRRCHVSAVT